MIKNNLLRSSNFICGLFSTFTAGAVLLYSPLLAHADTATPSTNQVSAILFNCTKAATPCGWTDLINLINAMIQYGIELIGIAFVLIILYTGVMYLTSGGDTSKVTKAREMVKKVVWGLVFTLCGFVIVSFILTNLGVNADFYSSIISK